MIPGADVDTDVVDGSHTDEIRDEQYVEGDYQRANNDEL